MKYPELTDLCKKCTGCQRLEDINFKGTNKCEYQESGLDLCKKILGTQERIKL